MRNAIMNLEYYAATRHRNLRQIPTADLFLPFVPFHPPPRILVPRVRREFPVHHTRVSARILTCGKCAFDERARCTRTQPIPVAFHPLVRKRHRRVA